MFYRIAIVQNEKEVFKYDCADWQKIMSQLQDFIFYKTDYYDEHNIEWLFKRLQEYDAVFFATNSLNADKIYDSCVDNTETIDRFINSGRGFFVGYSSKNKKREFLPQKYKCAQIERDFEGGESEFDGDLRFCDNGLQNLFFPTSKTAYISNSKNHPTISGLYFDYLDFEKYSTSFDIIVSDAEKNRALLCSSKKATSERVVVTTLPIDWQGQRDFFVNTVRFCTEGIPLICLISRNDLDDYADFSYQYLCRQLNYYKKSYISLTCRNSDDFLVINSTCNIIIFDSSWSENEIATMCKNHSDIITRNNYRILHYYLYESIRDDMFFKLTIHSAYQEIDVFEKQLLCYLESNIPTAKQKYSFDSSMIATYEAIRLLKDNQIANETLELNVIKYGIKRLLKDGSYDAMFIASCNFLALWTICGHIETDNEKYELLKRFVIEKIANDSSGISIYEKAQALSYLYDKIHFSDTFINETLDQIISVLKKAEGSELVSFGVSNCWKLLTMEAFVDKVVEHHRADLIQLIKKQVQVFAGKEASIKPVIVANYVFAVSGLLLKRIKMENNELHYIYQSLFSSMAYLNDIYDTIQVTDIYSACLVLSAMKRFHSLSMYPIDELLSLIEAKNESSSMELSRIDTLLDASSKQSDLVLRIEKEKADCERELSNYATNNHILQDKINKMETAKAENEAKLLELEKDVKHLRKKANKKSLTLIWVILLCGLTTGFLIWFSVFAVGSEENFFSLLWAFFKEKAWPLLIVIIGWPISSFIQSNIDSSFKRKDKD